MKISDYLKEMQYSVEIVINGIYREYKLAKILESQLKSLLAEIKNNYENVTFLDLNPELDDEGLSNMIVFNTYFESEKQFHYKTHELKCIKQKSESHKFSRDSLAGSLLQYAKQGIVLQYGKEMKNCPKGRMIQQLPLNELIWQGRNQTNHWDEGNFKNKNLIICFQKLALIDPIFNQYTNKNMAFELITLLGWKTFKDFASDMMLFERKS